MEICTSWPLAGTSIWFSLGLTCRRYYRRLFLSGRLLTLYSVLYKDLLSNTGVDLTAMVDQNYFSIAGNVLILHPDLEETWQVCTAMLFMQQGWQVSRRILREKAQEQRRSSPYFR